MGEVLETIIIPLLKRFELLSILLAPPNLLNGCVDGGPGDLATNKEYLRGIGRQ